MSMQRQSFYRGPMNYRPTRSIELTDPEAFLSELVKLPVSAQWKELGIQLGIPTYKLDEIQANNKHDPHFSQRCLSDMFVWWLENDETELWCCTCEAKFVTLAKALQVLQIYDAGKILCPAYAPNLYIERKVKLSMAYTWKQIGRKLGVPGHEIKAISQRIHDSDEFKDQICFIEMLKWWRENSFSATNLQEFIKALHEVGIHDEEKEVKEIHLLGMSPISKPKLLECVSRYSEYLKEKYLQQSVLPDSDWPPSLGGQFIRLVLIPRKRDVYANKYDSVIKMQKDYLRGNLDKILSESKTKTQVECVLQPVHCVAGKKNYYRALIDGAPGVGKTTLSRKYSQDWANGVLLQEYDLVVLLHLRDRAVSQASSIDDFFYHDDPELQQAVVRHVKQTSGEHVLLIFDGFDELSAVERSRGSFFMNIIQGKVLNRCSVIVTSRPYASVGLQQLGSINRHIEVLGFTEELIKQCIKKTITDNPRKAEELCTQLHERMDIMSLCYIPLNCAIMLYVYQQESFCLPKTLTELFSVFVLHAIKRHTKNMLGDTAARRLRTLDKLSKEIESQFSMLCKMAFDGLIEDKLVFHEEDIEEAFPNIGDQDIESQTLALMTVAKSYSRRGREVTCNFLHLTIQEFLAAKWAATNLPHMEIINLIRKSLHGNDRLRMMVLFLAGITKLDLPNVEKFFLAVHDKLVLTTNPPNQAFLLLSHLVYESENHKTSVHLTNLIIEKNFQLSYKALSGFEFLVVLTVLAQSSCLLTFLRIDCKEQHLKMYHEVCNHNVGVQEVELKFDGENHIVLKNFLEEASSFSNINVFVSKGFVSHEAIATLLSLTDIPNVSKLTFLSVTYESSKSLPSRKLRLSFASLTDPQFSAALSFFLHSGCSWDVLSLKCEENHLKLILEKLDAEIHEETSVQDIQLDYEGMDFVLLHDLLQKISKHFSVPLRVRLNWHNHIEIEFIKRMLSAVVTAEVSNLSVEFLSVVYRTFKTSTFQQRKEIELPSDGLSTSQFSTVVSFTFQQHCTWDVLKLKQCEEKHLEILSAASNHSTCVKKIDLQYDGKSCVKLLKFLQRAPQIQDIAIQITRPHLCTMDMQCLQSIASVKNVSKFSSFSFTSHGVLPCQCASNFCCCLHVIDVMCNNTNIRESHILFHDKLLGSLETLLIKNTALRVLKVFILPSCKDQPENIVKVMESLLSINKTLVCFVITWIGGSTSFERDPTTSAFVKVGPSTCKSSITKAANDQQPKKKFVVLHSKETTV